VHLQSQFARRRDDEGQRLGRPFQPLGLAEQRRGEREAVGDRLARPCLGRDEQVTIGRAGIQHGALNGGGLGIVAVLQRAQEGGLL
jgi:hypothetical protein